MVLNLKGSTMAATAVQLNDNEEQQQIAYLESVVAKQKAAYEASPYPVTSLSRMPSSA